MVFPYFTPVATRPDEPRWVLVWTGNLLKLEEVAVEEDWAEDSSLLEGELPFFYEETKETPSCLFWLRPLIKHCFQIQTLKTVSQPWLHNVVSYISVCGIVGSDTLMGFMVLHFTNTCSILASIIVQLAESTVYSLHWHLSDTQSCLDS